MSRQSTDTVAIPHARGPNMLETILIAMAREFQEDRSLCPKTYRAMRAVVETHGEAVGGKDAAEQVVNSEAKAAITHQTHLGNRTPAALAPCTEDQHSSERSENMNAQKDRPEGDMGFPITGDLISRDAALKIAHDKAFELDAEGGYTRKMQGATAGVICNAIRALPPGTDRGRGMSIPEACIAQLRSKNEADDKKSSK